MKTIFFAAALAFVGLVAAPMAHAQVIIQFHAPKKVEYFKKGQEESKKKADDVLSGKVFEDMKYKDKKTGKVLKYKELPAFQKGVIHVIAIEKLTQELQESYDALEDMLGKLKKVEGEKRAEKDEDIANHADVTFYKEEMLALRKEVATKYESTATAFFNKHQAMFTKEEMQGYVGQMRRYHDKHKLIERKE